MLRCYRWIFCVDCCTRLRLQCVHAFVNAWAAIFVHFSSGNCAFSRFHCSRLLERFQATSRGRSPWNAAQQGMNAKGTVSRRNNLVVRVRVVAFWGWRLLRSTCSWSAVVAVPTVCCRCVRVLRKSADRVDESTTCVADNHCHNSLRSLRTYQDLLTDPLPHHRSASRPATPICKRYHPEKKQRLLILFRINSDEQAAFASAAQTRERLVPLVAALVQLRNRKVHKVCLIPIAMHCNAIRNAVFLLR